MCVCLSPRLSVYLCCLSFSLFATGNGENNINNKTIYKHHRRRVYIETIDFTNLVVDPVCSDKKDNICNNKCDAEINQHSSMMRLQLTVATQNKLKSISCYTDRGGSKNKVIIFYYI